MAEAEASTPPPRDPALNAAAPPAAAADVDMHASLDIKGAAALPPNQPQQTQSPAGTPPPAQSDPATAGMSIKRPAHESEPELEPELLDEADSEEARARADKKRKVLEENKAAQRKRGNRMFGVMLGTLQRAKKQVEQVEDSGAGKKRAQLQERLREKLDAERRQATEKADREKELRELKTDIARREDEISAAEAIYRTRHSAKLNLAGFLCTTFTLPPPPTTTDAVSVPFVPRLPHAMKLTDPRAARPIYYLPYRLLPSQEDRIDDQIDAVKVAIRRDRDEWHEVKDAKLAELDKVKRRRQERTEESERKEREERQRRRREREDGTENGGDRAAASPPPPPPRRRRESSSAAGGPDRDRDRNRDERMRSRSRSASPPRSRSRRPRSPSRSRSQSPRATKEAMQVDSGDDADDHRTARAGRAGRNGHGHGHDRSEDEAEGERGPDRRSKMADDEIEY
ncbi:hypothetical protein JCM3774_000330 [Rhodotorula dairenensis]